MYPAHRSRKLRRRRSHKEGYAAGRPPLQEIPHLQLREAGLPGRRGPHPLRQHPGLPGRVLQSAGRELRRRLLQGDRRSRLPPGERLQGPRVHTAEPEGARRERRVVFTKGFIVKVKKFCSMNWEK